MDIKTKFNVGDSGFFMHDNRVVEGEVELIQITVAPRGQPNPEPQSHVLYKLTYNPVSYESKEKQIHEQHLFPTKADLLASL